MLNLRKIQNFDKREKQKKKREVTKKREHPNTEIVLQLTPMILFFFDCTNRNLEGWKKNEREKKKVKQWSRRVAITAV